jgi:hypothetical protein
MATLMRQRGILVNSEVFLKNQRRFFHMAALQSVMI